MPDLSGIATTPVMANYLLNMIFRGAGVVDPMGSAYLVNYIRITDKAIFEYEAARTALSAYIASNNRTLLLLKAVAHLETCINSLNRALKFADAMARYRPAPDIARATRRYFEGQQRPVRGVRNAIEHMDSFLAGGEVALGDRMAMEISRNGDSVQIAAHTLDLTELATLVQKLHELATELADYHEPA